VEQRVHRGEQRCEKMEACYQVRQNWEIVSSQFIGGMFLGIRTTQAMDVNIDAIEPGIE